MAKNDILLIDGIIDDRVELKLPSEKRDEAFEHFAFEQSLKEYDLSIEEIIHGSVDGRNDGGIDGFYILVNGHYLSDPQTFKWPKMGSVLDVWIITCKHHSTFKQAPLDNLVASITELFDFTIDSENFKGDYSEEIILKRNNLKLAYRKVSPRLSEFNIHFIYASRGNTDDMGESIISRSKQIEQISKDSFGNSNPLFNFYGSTELIKLHRKTPNFSFDLPFKEVLSSGERYVLLVDLEDYYNFVSDEGKLKRYLFDSNVRDFMGLNRVNEDIRITLENQESPDFWLLNNGVTILANGASVVGKHIQVENIQIVNGLQTTESIFRHFSNSGQDINKRSVLVKIIVSKEDTIRDKIIRATNNQTIVELASLHATDKIQRDIEEVFKRNDLFYERRKNFYKNQGLSTEQIITPLYAAAGILNLVLKAPHQATNLRSRFMRSESAYGLVFSESTDLNVWPKVVLILKLTDTFIETKRPNPNHKSEQFLKGKRQFISFITLSRVFNSFNFSISDIVNMDLSILTNEEFEKSWNLFDKVNQRKRNSKAFLLKVCEDAKIEWDIKHIEKIIHSNNITLNPKRAKTQTPNIKPKKKEVTREFLSQVNETLPEQPWKPGVHIEVCSKLDCSKPDYFSAVATLIEEGLRYTQKDGVVFDQDGNVISIDSERVDPESLKLKE